jgi:hypothetical protein
MLKKLSRKLRKKQAVSGGTVPRLRVSEPRWVVFAETGQIRQLHSLALMMNTSETMLVVVGKQPHIEVDEASWWYVERIKQTVSMRDDLALAMVGEALITLFKALPAIATAKWVLLNADKHVQQRIAKLLALYGVWDIVQVKGGGALSVFEGAGAQDDESLVIASAAPGALVTESPEYHRRNSISSVLASPEAKKPNNAPSNQRISEPLLWVVARQLAFKPPFSSDECARILDTLIESGISVGSTTDPATPFVMAGFHQRSVVTQWSPPRNKVSAKEGHAIRRLFEAKHAHLPITLHRALSILKRQEQRLWVEIGVEIPAPRPRSKEGSWTKLSSSGAHYQAIQALRKAGFTIDQKVAWPTYWINEAESLKAWDASPDKPKLDVIARDDGGPFDKAAVDLGIQPPFRSDDLDSILEAIPPENAQRVGLPPAFRRDEDKQALITAAGLRKQLMLSAWCPNKDHADDATVLNALVVMQGGYPILLDQVGALLCRPLETRPAIVSSLSAGFWNSVTCDDIGRWSLSSATTLSAMGFMVENVYVPKRNMPIQDNRDRQGE